MFAQNLGFHREEIIGQPITRFLTPASQEKILSGGYRRALGGQSLDEERTLVTKEGRLIETILHTLPHTDGEGNVIGTLSMYVDITRRKEAERKVQEYTESLEQRVAERTWDLVQSEEALRQQTIVLQEQNEELDAFAHTVAHDLKNPLSHITGYAELLKDEFEQMLESERYEAFGYILQGGYKMNDIIQELLLLASVRKEDVVLEPVPMGDVVAEVVLRLYPMIEAHHVEIQLPESWPRALGYGPWLEEVWANYLTNGIKYGGEPPVLICGATVQSDGWVAFWVRDNGPGLTDEAKEKLFVEFTQLERGRGRGHGLGLSIVQRILHKLGGEVFVESIPGQGSTFGFLLSHWNPQPQ
jgi:PAS domain S-box-containing protein